MFSTRKGIGKLFSSLMIASFFSVLPSYILAEPASIEDIQLYQGLGVGFFCNARSAGFDFAKSVGVSASTYAQVIIGRHGGMVESMGDVKLTNENILSAAEYQILTAAIRFCPQAVPQKVQQEIQAVLKAKESAEEKSQEIETN